MSLFDNPATSGRKSRAIIAAVVGAVVLFGAVSCVRALRDDFRYDTGPSVDQLATAAEFLGTPSTAQGVSRSTMDAEAPGFMADNGNDARIGLEYTNSLGSTATKDYYADRLTALDGTPQAWRWKASKRSGDDYVISAQRGEITATVLIGRGTDDGAGTPVKVWVTRAYGQEYIPSTTPTAAP